MKYFSGGLINFNKKGDTFNIHGDRKCDVKNNFGTTLNWFDIMLKFLTAVNTLYRERHHSVNVNIK